MDITIKKKMAEDIGLPKFRDFGLTEESWRWNKKTNVDIQSWTEERLGRFKKLLAEHSTVLGTKKIIQSVEIWERAKSGAGKLKPTSVMMFSSLLTEYLRGVDGHRLYQKVGEEYYLAHYVEEVRYHPPVKNRDYTTPASCSIDLFYEDFGKRHSKKKTFHEEDVHGLTIADALAKAGLHAETGQLRAWYLQEKRRYVKITAPESVGLQCLAAGQATDDVDGNPGGRERSWYWNRTNTYDLAAGGEPARVVVDVFRESDKEEMESRESRMDPYFWKRAQDQRRERPEEKKKKRGGDDDDDDIRDDDLDGWENPDDVEAEDIEVPLHPFICVFHMAKHLRLRTHVNNVTEYEYDRRLADKLILPDDLKALVEMLVEHKAGGFEDVIRHKSGGAVVTLAGRPGTGKTLTAECYAEAMGKPLYTVQYSQLGTDPNELEDELLKVFARAKRWGAITLLDEADVYVKTRGDDLIQNAIVGVFLRVLEYQEAVMFLTTNRPDDIDDAIASRCVARINYPMPSAADQERIWRIMADTNGAKLGDEEVSKIVDATNGRTEHSFTPTTSGRDIKNLLKLAMLMKPGQPITVADVKYVQRFKPTI